MKRRILLIDGNNLIFRSFFAVPPLSTRDGQATNAVYGSLVSFRSVISELKPDYVIIGWDSGKPTFRHLQDTTYKAHRPPVNDDLKSQFTIVQDAFNHLGVPQLIAPDGCENDDLLGTIAKKAEKADFEPIIVSNDKDFYQLCSDTLKVYSFTVKKKTGFGLVNKDYIKREYGCDPVQLVCIKSLTGEATDNIKGVNGIGPKTALSLITQHKNVYTMLQNMTINPKIKYADRILPYVDIIDNAYKLALIKTDVDLPDGVPAIPVKNIKVDERALWDFFSHYEIKSMLDNFHEWTSLFEYALGSVK
jgi:DNA polymerase-1